VISTALLLLGRLRGDRERLKIAKQVRAMRGFPKSFKIIARRGGYYGATFGAMSVTSSRDETLFGPFMYGVGRRHTARPLNPRKSCVTLLGRCLGPTRTCMVAAVRGAAPLSQVLMPRRLAGDEFGHRSVEKTAGPPKAVCACPM
jgi:hypothetical protein